MSRTLPIDAKDDAIKRLVVEWSELLAKKEFAEALAMFELSTEAEDWSPDLLERYIVNYGCSEPFDDEPPRELTSLLALPNANEIIANSIEVNREDLFGLDPANYVGMVHYDDVPLDGKPSDLTARFHIKKVSDNEITLEFLDIHVM